MSKNPIKFRVVEVIYENEELSNEEILGILKVEYPFDRSINEKHIEDYLLSLKVVGIIEISKVNTDSKDELKIYYKITEFGKSRLKYISNIYES